MPAVKASVAALEYHLVRCRAREELDDQAGVSHLASAMCSRAILRDAQEAATMIDNCRGSPAVPAVMDRYKASSMPVVKAALNAGNADPKICAML